MRVADLVSVPTFGVDLIVGTRQTVCCESSRSGLSSYFRCGSYCGDLTNCRESSRPGFSSYFWRGSYCRSNYTCQVPGVILIGTGLSGVIILGEIESLIGSLSHCGSPYSCLSWSVSEILLHVAGMLSN